MSSKPVISPASACHCSRTSSPVVARSELKAKGSAKDRQDACPTPNHALHDNRRSFLWRSANGFGSVALAWLLNREAAEANTPTPPSAHTPASPYAPKPTHFPPIAKRVIHICSLGGVSHVDTWDHKPGLANRHGQDYKDENYDPFFGRPGRLMKSPWEFKRHGQAGLWTSSLFPNLATCVDDLCFINSMHSRSSNHTPATFLENTGFTMNGFPSLGSWVSYGLGSENQDLPAYIVLPDARGLPAGSAINWTQGFLAAAHQGVAFNARGEPIPDLFTPGSTSSSRRLAESDLLQTMNRDDAAANPGNDELHARIRAYELAAQMQLSVPGITDLSGESDATQKLYGLDQPVTRDFATNCLRARRLCERGVRFVQLFNGGAFGGRPRINWDAHEGIEQNHGNQAAVMDKPVAGLIKDLKSRGMLKDTLVLWTTEFGRTPVTQGLESTGRDHHPNAFTIWMAGAGVKPGQAYGASDDIGFHVADKPLEFYDIHATMLHLLGMDHERLTFLHNGIQRRLTNVHGHVVKELLSS